MNYKEIVDAAKAYTDRDDEELAASMVAFTRVVEAKINNALRTGDQSVRAQLWLRRDQELYSLPSDWGGARDVEILNEGEQYGRSLSYLSPEAMSSVSRQNDSSQLKGHNYYTIVAGQIRIAPPGDGDVLELVYYQRLPELNDEDDTNWLTEKNCDAYIFGLCAEIGAFAKDAVSFETYKARFGDALMDITQEDQITRWSGPALRTQVEGLVV